MIAFQLKYLFKMLLTFVIVMCILSCTISAPYHYLETFPERQYTYDAGNLRPIPAIGDLVSGSSWFPVEVNVPEVIGNFVNGIISIPNTISNGISGIVGYVQRIPFVNRIISQERPRPHLVLLPNTPSNSKSDNFNMYSDDIDIISQYP